jgi:hypothetical protein
MSKEGLDRLYPNVWLRMELVGLYVPHLDIDSDWVTHSICRVGADSTEGVDKWTHDTGRAPMIQKNRRSWAAYMEVAKHEMPTFVRKRITFWGRITYLSLILIVVVATIDAGWHRH